MPTGLRDPAKPRSGRKHILKTWRKRKRKIERKRDLEPRDKIPAPFPLAAHAPGPVGPIVTGPLLRHVQMAYDSARWM